jgi:hypothetical protein
MSILTEERSDSERVCAMMWGSGWALGLGIV